MSSPLRVAQACQTGARQLSRRVPGLRGRLPTHFPSSFAAINILLLPSNVALRRDVFCESSLAQSRKEETRVISLFAQHLVLECRPQVGACGGGRGCAGSQRRQRLCPGGWVGNVDRGTQSQPHRGIESGAPAGRPLPLLPDSPQPCSPAQELPRASQSRRFWNQTLDIRKVDL